METTTRIVTILLEAILATAKLVLKNGHQRKVVWTKMNVMVKI